MGKKKEIKEWDPSKHTTKENIAYYSNRIDIVSERTTHKIPRNQKDETTISIELKIKDCKVVILHPSFVCPSIIAESDPIRIFILTDQEFYGYTKDAGNISRDASGWNSSHLLRQLIARGLKISVFGDAVNQKIKDTKGDKTIFNKEDAIKNIAITYLGDVKKTNLSNQRGYGASTDEEEAINRSNFKKEEDFEGIIRKDVIDLYSEEKLQYLFQIDIHNHKKKGGEKGILYDISWITNDPNVKLHNEDLLERQDLITNNFIKNKKYIKDTKLTHAFIVDVDEFKYETDNNQPIQNYHPIWVVSDSKKKKKLNIGQLTDVHISSRQHAYTKSKAELIPGSETNEIGPMVNTSYDTLKDLMEQFGLDEKIDLLFFTGDLIDHNRNYHPKKFMSGKLSTTGDIWKEMYFDNMNQRNEDGSPKTVEVKRNPNKRAGKGGIGAGRTYTKILPNNDDYPSSIDNVVMYSLFLNYYIKYKKPIFLISGNHECYSMPYGISPRTPTTRAIFSKAIDPIAYSIEKQVEFARLDRINDMKKEEEKGTTGGNKANTGVPADHNLTFGEATLMYGPSYHQIIMFGKGDGSNTRNFKPAYIDWFYTVFTPLTDYFFKWGKQMFTALEWGDGERMVVIVDGQATFGGILPRATESLTSNQLSLVKKAVKINDSNNRCNILLTHFTFVNYKQQVAINRVGRVDIADTIENHGLYDYGTFEENRKPIYKMIAEKKIDYILSGHSHRSALYQNTGLSRTVKHAWSRLQFNVRGFVSENSKFKDYDPDASKIIVSASGGSIPIQNYDGELVSWGLDTPSGSYIYFDNGKEEIGIKKTNIGKIKAAQPRLAVALDFADVLGAANEDSTDTGGFIYRLESTKRNGDIILIVNPKFRLPDIEWIHEIIIYKYYKPFTKPEKFNTSITFQKDTTKKKEHKYILKVENSSILHEDAMLSLPTYISIRPKEELPGEAYSNYNLKSPWQFRIELKLRKKIYSLYQVYKSYGIDIPDPDGWYKNSGISGSTLFNQMSKENGGKGPQGLFIDRHKKFGETPDHRMYTAFFYNNKEYKFDWKITKSGDSK